MTTMGKVVLWGLVIVFGVPTILGGIFGLIFFAQFASLVHDMFTQLH